MMQIQTVLYLLILHFVADFVMQDVSWSETKSYKFSSLTKHVLTYSLIMLGGVALYTGSLEGAMAFSIITFLTHLVIDGVSSRITSNMFKARRYGTHIPNTGAFTIIGADQLLHYIQIYITYEGIFL